MNKILTLVLFMVMAFSMNAQKSDVIGQWVFAEALNKQIDQAGLDYIKANVIGKWNLSFKSDGQFDTFMMGKQLSGTWVFDTTSNSIIISGTEGGPQEFEVLNATKNELELKFGLGKFLLSKVN